MTAKDLRARETDDLVRLLETMRKEAFASRMKHFANRLEDTSLLAKARRDIARVETVLRERAGAKGADP